MAELDCIAVLCGTKNHLPNKSYSPSCYIKLFKVQNYIVYLMQEGKNWNDHGITWMLDEALNSMNIKVSIHKSENYDTICQRYQIWMFWALERSFCIWNFPCNHGLLVCNAKVIFLMFSSHLEISLLFRVQFHFLLLFFISSIINLKDGLGKVVQ